MILQATELGLIPLRVDDSTRIRKDVLKHGYVTLRLGEKHWDGDDTSYAPIPRALYAGSMVGLLPLTADTAVLVAPKFPSNLTHMVSAVGETPLALDLVREYQESAPNEGAEAWMLDHLARSFVNAVEEVVQQGLQRKYIERRETTSSPKGRLLVGATMARHSSRGVGYKVEVAYHERTELTPANQALLEGLHWVLGWTASRRDLNAEWRRTVKLLHTFDYVPRDREGRFKRDLLVRHPRLMPEARSAYRRALPIAHAITERRGFSIDAAEGTIGLTSMLTDAAAVFEAFVRLRLQEYLPQRHLSVVDGNTMQTRPLYTPALAEDIPEGADKLPLSAAKIAPDILIEDGGSTLLVADVKYIPIRGHAGRGNVEQIVTYAHRLDCGRAISIHPTESGQHPGLFVSGRIGSTTVYSYRVNLGAQDLEEEMRRMAASLGKLCGATQEATGRLSTNGGV